MVGFALFAGRLDNISVLLLGGAHNSVAKRVWTLVLLPLRMLWELMLAVLSLFLLIPGIW